MWLFNHCTADHGSVLKHILQIHKITVVHMLCIIVRIMEVDDSFSVCLHNIMWEKHSCCQVTADLSCHIISLYAVDCRVLVRVLLLYILVVVLDQ